MKVIIVVGVVAVGVIVVGVIVVVAGIVVAVAVWPKFAFFARKHDDCEFSFFVCKRQKDFFGGLSIVISSLLNC